MGHAWVIVDNLDYPIEYHKVLGIGSLSGKSSCWKRKLQHKNGQWRRSGAGGKGLRDKKAVMVSVVCIGAVRKQTPCTPRVSLIGLIEPLRRFEEDGIQSG